jgi:hypothetical protein
MMQTGFALLPARAEVDGLRAVSDEGPIATESSLESSGAVPSRATGVSDDRVTLRASVVDASVVDVGKAA